MTKDLNTLWETKLKGKAWQVKEEFISLLDFIQTHEIHNILEIGAYKGGSALGFLEIGCNVTSIDIIKQPEIKKLEKQFPSRYKFFLREDWDAEIHEDYFYYDMLWIDGDHSYEGALKDFKEFSPLVSAYGYVAFHDVVDSELHRKQNCEVWRVLAEVEKGNEFWDFITDGTWGGITVIKI